MMNERKMKNTSNLLFTIITLTFKPDTVKKEIYKVMKILSRFKTMIVTALGSKKEIQL